MALDEKKWQEAATRFERLSGLDIIALLREANEAREIGDEQARGFITRAWGAYRQQREAVLDERQRQIDEERATLETA